MTRSLKLAKDLTFPLDAVTQTFLVVGKRGSGKSNTAARFVEQLHHARLPFVVLDPVDTWWGLKAGRDGEEGLDVYVFGGRKADLPLEAGSGTLIADVLCEHRLSMVLSVKHLSGRERSTFMVDFARTLFQKWSGGPLHVVLEEAHELAPQNTQNAKEGEQAMLGAFKRLWKLGRSSGIGGTAVTQRPASLSKDITTQSEILIAHRTIGPQDVKAVGEWVKYHGEHLDILADLPTLPTGEAFVWAPEFPEGQPIGLKRTSVFLRETYDSASTPKVGEQRVEPKELAAVDLERLRAKMAATIEKAKADDPRELRKEIARLQRESAGKVAAAPTVQRVEVPIVDAATLNAVDRGIARIEECHGALVESFRQVLQPLLDIRQSLQRIARQPPTVPMRAPAPTQRPDRSMRPPTSSGDGSLSRGERKILTALAQYPEGRSKTQVAILTGYAHNGGGFNNYLSALRGKGLLEGIGERLQITDEGLRALGTYDPLPTGQDLLRHWLGQLGKAERAILEELASVYPQAIGKDELGTRTSYEPNGGGFNNALSRLRTLELIQGRGELRASDELFT